MKWILIVFGSIGALVLILWLVGASLPRDHVAARRARFRKPAAEVWGVITDLETAASWRSTVTRVERRTEGDREIWVEHQKEWGDEMPLEVVERVAPWRFVTRIASEALPYGGTWTFELDERGGETVVTITERGFVRSPLLRVLGRIFRYDPAESAATYLRDLGAKLGESVTPEPA
jgi:uncharacterized protein YndB with AHSA1/START domain